jgi:aspartate/methionine/tyrosine aminotransferase
LGATVVPLVRRAEREFRRRPSDVDRALATGASLVVLTNLHNPSSAAVDGATLAAVGEVAKRRNARVLVDEVYWTSRSKTAPPSAASLGDTFVVTSSLTKTCGLGGLRAGWIVAAPVIAERLWDTKNLFGVDDAHVAERLALVGLREKRACWRARGASSMRTGRAGTRSSRDAGSDLEVPPSRFGSTTFPRVLRVSADELAALLRERYETSIVPGRFFGAPEHVRIGFCGATEEFPGGAAPAGPRARRPQFGEVSFGFGGLTRSFR